MATHPVSLSSVKTFLRRFPAWKRSLGGKAICADYRMKDFLAAVRLIGRIARLAEKMDHHPDLHLTRYRRLRVELYTHSTGGLTQKDLLLATKIDHLPKQLKLLR